jgi:polyisoprenoid-binding protein YceI
MKKIIIIIIALLIIGGIGLFLIPWGGVESEVVKTEIIQNSDDLAIDDEIIIKDLKPIQPNSYKSSIKQKDNLELLFNLEGLKKTTGKFNDVNVTFTIDSVREKSQLIVEINSASIFTNNDMRDEHIKEPDFFNVNKFPIIKYESNSIKTGDTSLVAKGELELLGQKNTLDLPFKYLGEGKNEKQEIIHAFEGGFEFDRTQYGMQEEAGVGNIVKITFYAELK